MAFTIHGDWNVDQKIKESKDESTEKTTNGNKHNSPGV